MTEMPEFPARGAMEWHNDLKAYVDAVRNRGDLPEHTDLDELQSVGNAGVWRLVTGNEYGGLPEGFSVNVSTVLRVDHSGVNNAVVQTITKGQGSSPLDMWIREANMGDTWGVWHRLITDREVDVLRPEQSYSLSTPIADGQTLYVLDPDVAATDDVSGPGWSTFWTSTAGTWVGVPELLDGRGGSQEGNGRRFRGWNQFERFADVEILSRIATLVSGSEQSGAVIARAGGSEANCSGYLALVSTVSGVRSLVIGKYVGGEYTPLGSAEISVDDAQPYWIRFRCNGTTLQASAWVEGESEPVGWMVTVSDNDLATGRMGIFHNASTRSAWDYFSVAINGGAA